MKKENTFVYIVIIILFSAFLYVSYTGLPKKDQVSELLWLPNQLDFQTPSPQPAPPPPTPVPTPRQATEESSQKTQLPTNPEAQYYLQPGPYTTPGPEIKAVKITPISSGALKEGQTPTPPDVDQYEFNIIRGIFQYMDAFPSYKTDDDNSWALTVNDIFSKGINENYCGQYGRFFVTLARLYGIPAKYTQTYFTEWAVGQKLNGCWDGTLEGHVYAKVYVNGKWYAVDSTQREFVDMDNDGNILGKQGNVKAIILAEGRDAGDTLPYISRWCVEGLRYHSAIPGLLLCANPQYRPTSSELMLMLACSKPLQPAVESQQKGEK